MKNDKETERECGRHVNLYQNTAWIYDIEIKKDHPLPDVPFYLEYAKKQCGEDCSKGDILELGCGTGRVALPLAEEGFGVTGIELSQQMLDIFQQKLSDINLNRPEFVKQIEIIQGDITNFNLSRKFALIIIPFRTFQALTDFNDIESLLNCVREHLSNDGSFILNTSNPDDDLLEEEWERAEEFNEETIDEETGLRIARYDCIEHIDSLNQIIYGYLAYNLTYPDGHFERVKEPLQMKYYFRDQLYDLLENSGFEITEEFSWYDKSPPGRTLHNMNPSSPDMNPSNPDVYQSDPDVNQFNPDGREIILVCRKAVGY